MTMMTRTSIRSFSRWFIQKAKTRRIVVSFRLRLWGDGGRMVVVPMCKVFWYPPTSHRVLKKFGASRTGGRQRASMASWCVTSSSSSPLFRRNRLCVLRSFRQWSVVRICVFYGSCFFIWMTVFSSVPTIQFPERCIAHGFCFLFVTINWNKGTNNIVVRKLFVIGIETGWGVKWRAVSAF